MVHLSLGRVRSEEVDGLGLELRVLRCADALDGFWDNL